MEIRRLVSFLQTLIHNKKTMVRLYLRGLPEDCSILDVVGRFASFGEVEACELVPNKTPETLGTASRPSYIATPPFSATPIADCRFAYVEMQAKDDSSLARCLSLVGVLHVNLRERELARCRSEGESIQPSVPTSSTYVSSA